ncbi:hypothetical protein ACFWW0_11315 [Streptomyces violascens]|uniref:hypothetical protein n=1 Tax=Streptomyces violascens TaxID=67381 RepID=UPI0036A02EBD
MPIRTSSQTASRGGNHRVGALAGGEEDRHDQPGDLGGAVGGRPEGAADVLHDLDLRAAGVGKADRRDADLARDVDAFTQHAYGGEDGPVDLVPLGGEAVRELVQDCAAFGDEVVAAQPVGPAHGRPRAPAARRHPQLSFDHTVDKALLAHGLGLHGPLSRPDLAELNVGLDGFDGDAD